MRLDDYIKLMHEIGIDDQKICVICDDECAFKGTVGALSQFDFRFLLSSAEVKKAEFDGNVMVITVVSKNQE